MAELPQDASEALIRLLAQRAETNNLTVEDAIAFQGIRRAAFGLEKYGLTLDRNDLTAMEWLQHFKEEMMDGARYAERLQRYLEQNNLLGVRLPTP